MDCGNVVFDPEHSTGLMLKETGALETKVYYYRENSAASHLCPEDLKDELFQEAELLHFTGITPALSKSCEQTILEAIRLGRKHGLLLSFDPNIKKAVAREGLRPIIARPPWKAILCCWACQKRKRCLESGILTRYSIYCFKKGAPITRRSKNGGKGAWAADREHRAFIAPYPCRCIDPVGAGDGFNAGFLAGILKGKDLETAGKMGAVCGAFATQTTGDIEGYPDQRQMEMALSGLEVTYR